MTTEGRYRIGIVIPDRGDRPDFLKNCKRMILSQIFNQIAIPTYTISIQDYIPENDEVDITQRYRRGYETLRNKDLDVIFFIENDDWYSPYYIETMLSQWEKFKKPELFGTAYTYYYHLELKAYFKMEHHTRSSAMNTMIKPDMNFEWPVDMEPFLDIWLWQTILPMRIVFMPEKIISVGIKHGVGKTIAGGNHIIDDRVRVRYTNPEANGNLDVNEEYPEGFLKTVLDPESFNFYNNYFK